MNAKKMGRVARLVLVLAVAFGGLGVATAGAHETHSATPFTSLSLDWE